MLLRPKEEEKDSRLGDRHRQQARDMFASRLCVAKLQHMTAMRGSTLPTMVILTTFSVVVV